MGAEYEVRITPLMRGVAGQLETDSGSHNPAGATVIEEADTTLVTQFTDLEVDHQLNEPRTGRVVLSIHDPVVANLAPFAQAVWIGYKRPLETLSEAIIYGQCNVVTDYANETVTLEIADPALRCQHHYIRRGDAALNVDPGRGRIESHAGSITTILDAARNIASQQDRGVPVLGIEDAHGYYSASFVDASFIDFERGQECWDLIQQIVRDVGGPDFDLFPLWFFPTTGYYARLWTYDPADPPPNLTGSPLARDLDPADPDNPVAGEVIFDFGIGQDNLVGLVETPGRPTTHAHVLDQPGAYRETAADAASSYDVGIFVDWIAKDAAIERPTRTSAADTSPLRALADAHVKAYGRPPRFLTATLRPDDVLGFHYGHPEWGGSVPPGTEYLGGEWYIGDYVRVRGLRGERSTNELMRITAVKFGYDHTADLVMVSVDLIPAVGGEPGDSDEVEFLPGGDVTPPSVAVTAPADGATVSGAATTVSATATDAGGVASVEFLVDGVAISPGGFDIEEPYTVTLDTTTLTDGTHTLTARATDTSGNQTSVSISVTVDNDVVVPPPPPPPPVGSNLLYTDGRVIRKVSDDTAVSLRLVNLHVGGFAWGADAINDIAAQGFNGVRLLCNWKRIEPTTPGSFSATELAFVQTTIDRCRTAGLYVILCTGVTDPKWENRASYLPSWSYNTSGPVTPVAPWTGTSLFAVFASMGEAYFRKMMQEFGHEDIVVAFDKWNEPDMNSASAVQQGFERIIDWGRDEANGAGKCWLVTNMYSSQSAANAFNNWAALDWSHGDLWLQVHSYFVPTAPSQTGWSTSNGMRSGSFWNGSPEATGYSTANKQAMRNHLATWKQIGQERNAPVVLGELGVQYWKATASQRDDWMRDMIDAAEAEEFAGVAGWIYGNDSDDWSLERGGTWRPEAARIAAFTSVLT